MQPRQIGVNGLPDDLQIDLEVTVGYSVAHLIGECQGQARVLCRELGLVLLDIVARLADDLEVADYGILRHFVL